MPRIDYAQADPDGYHAMRQFDQYVKGCGLERSLLELIKVRSSQINGCGYCIDMHTKDARLNGESEQRLYALVAWQDTPFFSERERTALAWTEAVTLVSESHIPDDLYENVRKVFSEKELVDLTLAIIAINGWNRLAIGFRTEAGTYQPNLQKT